ncbi:MAG: tetratricopeptide repeat protein, partial [Nitrospirota bacterium]
MNKQSTVNSHQSSVKRENKRITVHCSLFTIHCLLLTAYFLLLIVGCGYKPSTLSDAHSKAIDFNQRGEYAFKKSDYKKALSFYNEALKVNRSIENIDGIAINLINMATVYRKIGDRANAHICVDEILNTSNTVFSSFRLSEAAFIKAILYVDDGKYNSASEWADKASSFCKNAECLTEGRIYNLKAKIALSKENPESTINYGIKGLELNKKYGDKQEVANSLRLIADAKATLNQLEDARKLYEDALSLDKTLGLS